jgi:hypothetical protein
MVCYPSSEEPAEPALRQPCLGVPVLVVAEDFTPKMPIPNPLHVTRGLVEFVESKLVHALYEAEHLVPSLDFLHFHAPKEPSVIQSDSHTGAFD